MESLNRTLYQNNTRTVSGTPTIRKDDVVLDCNTSTGAVTINLLEIPANFWSTTWKLYIFDISNNASVNNIIINAPTGFTINNAASLTLNTNGAGVVIQIGNNTNFAGTLTVSSGGGGGLTQVQVSNTVFVSKLGNDGTGLVERLDKPFLTIAAARAAALAYWTGGTAPAYNRRKLIKVFSGTYNEQIVLANFVDFDLGDSIIELQSGVGLGTIDDNNVACDSVVYGSGFIRRTVAGTGNAILTQNAGTYLIVNCSEASSLVGDSINCTAGTQIIRALKYVSAYSGFDSASITSGGQTIYSNSIASVNCAGGIQTIYANAPSSERPHTCSGGVQNIYGDATVDGNYDIPVAYCSGGVQNIYGNVTQINTTGASASAFAVHCDVTGTQNIVGKILQVVTDTIPCAIKYQSSSLLSTYSGDIISTNANAIELSSTGKCRIKSGSKVSTLSGGGGNSAIVQTAGTPSLEIDSATIISTGAQPSIAGTMNVYCYGANQANNAVAGTITQKVSSILISADVI